MKATLKIIIIIFIPAIILSFKFLEDDPKNFDYQYSQSDIMIISSKKMDGNNISTWYRNNGSFNRDPVTSNAGFQWPKGAGSQYTVRYASGVWIGAKIEDSIHIAMAEYSYEYLPGYVDDNGIPQGKDDPDYKVYVIDKGDTLSDDYINWPVNQGAYLNQNDKPYLSGDQSMWLVYTDGYPESHSNNAGSTAPLKAQILNYNWCYNQNNFLKDVIFSEYRIINRSNKTWDSTFFSFWSDDDIGSNANGCAAGCDTTMDLGFVYYFGNVAPPYGNNAPAVSYLLLNSPLIYTGNPSDIYTYYQPPGSQNQIQKIGYKSMGMTAFNVYYNGDPNMGDPRNYRETWNALRGLRTQTGAPIINPLTGNATKYYFSGDPESQTGWLQPEGRNLRQMVTMGPITIAPGDTQNLVTAQIVARGINHRNSVTLLKSYAKLTKRLYENNFNYEITPPKPEATAYAPGDGKVYLKWNDSAEIRSFENKLSGGIYNFQGYNIYQIRNFSVNPSKADTVLIKTYDIVDGITNIYDSVYLNEYEGIVYGIVQRGSDNGISRYHVAERDTFTSKYFINGSEYKFAVSAYYYDPSGGLHSYPKVIESPKEIIKIIPQSLIPGTTVSYNFGDTILANQKDLAVMPVVFKPLELINAKYTSTFSGAGSDLSWTLIREQNGDTQTLLENIKDFTGSQDTAKVIDGFLLLHQNILDSGVVKDPDDPIRYVRNIQTLTGAWEWEGSGNIWFTGPDTTAIKGIPSFSLFRNNQFQSRSIGMSFPTSGTYRGLPTRIKANATQFFPGTGANTLLTGGPLRKIQIVFGHFHSSMAYRYVPVSGNALASDSNLLSTPFADMVSVPFSVFAEDDLDSSGGNKRRLNIAFVDADGNGQWDPDTTAMGKFQITYILASDYSEILDNEYTSRNIGFPNPVIGFSAFDIMYAWVPRVKIENGAAMTFNNGDKLTVSPYRPTRGDFVPGYPVKYSWETKGTQTDNINLAASQIDRIKVFPNPYYGFSELEYTDNPEKMIYFSHLPGRATIYIYTLDGVLVRKIERNESNPEVSLEKWDLKNDEGRYVASGMYIAYIDAKAAGTKVLKLAVFTRN